MLSIQLSPTKKIELAVGILLTDAFEAVDPPLNHKFCGGLYIRDMFIPSGTMVVTLVHRTENPFFIIQGSLSTYDAFGDKCHIEAPYIGITKPGTQRVILAHEDVRFITVHVPEDDEGPEDIDKIERRLFEEETIMGVKEVYEAKLHRQIEGAS